MPSADGLPGGEQPYKYGGKELLGANHGSYVDTTGYAFRVYADNSNLINRFLDTYNKTLNSVHAIYE